MKAWKTMKLWKKVVLVIVALFVLRACTAGSGTRDVGKAQEPTAQTVAHKADAFKLQPNTGFVVEQKDKNVMMTFECKNPNVKGSGFNIVYRDYNGNVVTNQGWKTYWTSRKFDRNINPEQWIVMEDGPAGPYPKADLFLMAAWEMRDRFANPESPSEIIFAIAKDREDASLSKPMVMSGSSVVLIAASTQSKNPCSVLADK